MKKDNYFNIEINIKYKINQEENSKLNSKNLRMSI